MTRWWLVIALLLSLGINAGIVATLMAHRWGVKQAQKLPAEKPLPPPNGQEGSPQKIIRLADQLGLEGDPRRRFISLQGNFFAETFRLRTEQAEIQRELRRELASPSPHQAHIDSLLQESGRAFLGLEQALVKNVVESRRLLNPDQEQKFLKILARLRLGGGPGGLDGGQGQGQQRRRRRVQEPDQRPAPPPSARAARAWGREAGGTAASAGRETALEARGGGNRGRLHPAMVRERRRRKGPFPAAEKRPHPRPLSHLPPTLSPGEGRTARQIFLLHPEFLPSPGGGRKGDGRGAGGEGAFPP